MIVNIFWILLIMKLIGVVDWSWLWITLPLWIYFPIFILGVLCYVVERLTLKFFKWLDK
jgi:hypothetical protein